MRVADAETVARASSSSGPNQSTSAWSAIVNRSAPGRILRASVISGFRTLSHTPSRHLEVVCAVIELMQVVTFGLDRNLFAGSALSGVLSVVDRIRDPVRVSPLYGAVPLIAVMALCAAVALACPLLYLVQFLSVLRGGIAMLFDALIAF
eukprot:m51a1_g10558 hypothetical protein (150) ;mRNA; f:65786-66499